MKKAVVSVINDLTTDQRVNKVCLFLADAGFETLLVGRKKKASLPLDVRRYNTKRMRLIFEKGFFFYAEFSIRLFLFLLFRKADLLVSNDLDTLTPNYLVHKIKRIPLVYDSHEYFTEMPEVLHRPTVRNIWLRIEKWIFPKLKDAFTVSRSIAEVYRKKYNVDVKVLRNVPLYSHTSSIIVKTKRELDLPENKKIILLQGSGINMDRGAEEMILSMHYIEGAILLIIGGGDVIGELKEMTRKEGLSEKVFFIPGQPYHVLFSYTANADLGVTLDKNTNLNYRYSLPNKLFDYIHAGIPVLASPLKEVKKIIEHYNTGVLVSHHEPRHIAEKIRELLSNERKKFLMKENARKAAKELCWENEIQQLKEVYLKYV